VKEMPNKVQDFEVSDTTGDDIYSAAHFQKIFRTTAKEFKSLFT